MSSSSKRINMPSVPRNKGALFIDVKGKRWEVIKASRFYVSVTDGDKVDYFCLSAKCKELL